ncbi:MAG: LysM peptidoglycan-binding domain-containing protein [Acidimicrobiales bacterium]|nr:LysM peptidoglycan-binding domain-containing protein [Acidimicrobiales bacterium]
MATHIVSAGETMFGLARRYGTTVGELQARNGIADPSMIFVGQALDVPDPPGAPTPPPPDAGPAAPSTYSVQPGDTLFGIARRFGTTVAELQARNGIADPNLLAVGQVLVVGDAAPVVTPPLDPPPPPGPTLPIALFGARAADAGLVGLVPLFDQWADAYAVARDLLKGLAYVESSWRSDALSPSGAIGLCQVLPSTASWIASALLGGAALDPWNPAHNLQLGSRYLRYLFDLLADETSAVAAYYQGPGSVRRNGISAAGVAYANRVAAARVQFR